MTTRVSTSRRYKNSLPGTTSSDGVDRSMHSLSRQLAQQFREKIETGEWVVGCPLPTTRKLAKDYRVSLNTVQSAYRELQANDLIERVPRRGGFVKARSSDIVAAARARQGTVVGIVTPFPPEASEDQSDDWSNRIVRAVEGMLLDKGLHLSMFSYRNGDTNPNERIVSRIDQMGADLAGLICFSRPAITGLTEQLDRRTIPWVSINRIAEQSDQNFITASNLHGGRCVGRCFARLGYDRVLVLANRMEPGTSSGDKFFGFIHGYTESGKLLRNVDYIACDDITEASGYEACGAYLDKFGPPQGIFTTGDYLALGAIRLCRERGISVPQKVGVVGATGLDVAAYAHPSLTVLAQPMEQMGIAAASTLLGMIQDGIRRVPGQYVPSPFIFRESLVVSDELRAELEAFTQVNVNAPSAVSKISDNAFAAT